MVVFGAVVAWLRLAMERYSFSCCGGVPSFCLFYKKQSGKISGFGNFGEFLMRCARPPKGMPKGPKKKKKKKITIDNTTLKHQNFRASNKERNFIQYIVSLHGKLASHC